MNPAVRRYAITGAKGTGKSTLLSNLKRLAATREDILFLDSPGAKAKRLAFPLGQSGTDDTHLFFATRHLANINASSQPIIIMDRCFVDHFAYVLHLSRNQHLIDLMAETLRLVATSYSHVFVCPLHDSLPPLRENTESEEFRSCVQATVVETLKSNRVAHTILPADPIGAADCVWSICAAR